MRLVEVPRTLRMTRSHSETVRQIREVLGALHVKNPSVVASDGFSRQFADALAEALPPDASFTYIGSASFPDVQRVESTAFNSGADCVVAIGGGKILDVGKFAAFRCHLPFVAVPTQVSHDGIASPIAVIRGEDGRKRSLGARMPEAVIAPLEVIGKAPASTILAGVGDLLSNLSALEDWRVAQLAGHDAYDDFAAMVAKQAAELVRRELQDCHVTSREFLGSLIEGLMLSGIAMAICGSSRPCSGSEHLISHALDYLELSETPHGVQVGCISLFSSFLQRAFDREYARSLGAIGFPLTLTDVAPRSTGRLEQVFETARTMRPGRYTILDMYTNGELLERYREFEGVVESLVRTGWRRVEGLSGR